MQRQYEIRESMTLGRDMELLVFGHAGLPVIVFPPALGRFYYYENNGVVAALAPCLQSGRMQLYCVDSLDGETWYNRQLPVERRAAAHEEYERYIIEEIAPFIRQQNQTPGLVVTGCDFGAYHSINISLRHPGVFSACLAIDGKYELRDMLPPGQYSDGVYFNAPLDYLPGLSDPRYLDPLRRQERFLLVTGNDEPWRAAATRLDSLLADKGLTHELDVWDGVSHDWSFWRAASDRYLRRLVAYPTA